MTHDGIECGSFWDYVDGDLDDARSGAYRRHLASCPACRLNLEEYSLIAECLGWGGEEAPPEHLRRVLLEEFRRAYPAQGRVSRTVSWASILGRPLRVPVWGAAVALLGALALVYAVRVGQGARKAAEAEPAPREEYVAYQVYGADGTLKAAVRTTIQQGSAR